MSVSRTTTIVGPQDQGRRMSLDDFEFVEVKEGYRYELSRGVIVVSDIPDLVHFAQYGVLRDQLARFKLDHPNRIYNFGGGSEDREAVADSDPGEDRLNPGEPRRPGDSEWNSHISKSAD